jgi:hypothetical protein
MILTFITSFNLADKKVRITDTTNYAGVTAQGIFGNVTARVGNTIFHQNTNFDNSADIVIGNNSYVDFDLPLNADGTVRQTTYSFEYEVKILDESIGGSDVIAPVSSTFSNLVFTPANPSLISEISGLISAGAYCKALFYGVNPSTGIQILSTTGDDTINFAPTTDLDYIDIDTVSIVSTSYSYLTNIYDFCDKSPKADLCVTSDCFFATLEAIDSTAYLATQTIVDRTLTINWPRLANGNAVQSPVTTSNASEVVGPNLYTGDFLVTLSTNITWTQIDGLVITNTIAARSDFNVNCDGGICEAYACIKAYAVQYQEAVAQGSRQISQFQQQNFQILIYCNLYNLAVECQHTTEARAILVALSEYMNTNGVTVMGCSCGCGNTGNNNTEPTVIYPLYNTATYNSATEIAEGIIQIATQAETDAGVNDTKAITPLKLANYIGFLLPIASQTIAGIIEIATQLEINTGTDNTRAVTPLTLSENIITRIAGQATAESAATGSPVTSINNISLLTARGWRYAWNKALTLTWTFISKINFAGGVNVEVPSIPVSPTQGDIYYNNSGPLGVGYYVSSEDYTNAKIITTADQYVQATESTIGVAQLSTQAESEAAASAVIGSINNTKILTPKGWRWAWNKALTLAWTFLSKITFASGINVSISGSPTLSDGDIAYTGTMYNGKVEGNSVFFLTSFNKASQEVVNGGTNDNDYVTPTRLLNKFFNSANITTGTDIASLNAVNGQIQYSTPINSTMPKAFVLNNTSVNVGSVILWSIWYPSSLGDEQVYPMSYQTAFGQVVFYVGLAGGLVSDTNIIINFTILNP